MDKDKQQYRWPAWVFQKLVFFLPESSKEKVTQEMVDIATPSVSRLVAIREALGIKRKMRKLSPKATEHIKKFGISRNDLPDDISEDGVLEMDDWDAGRIIAERLASDGNVEELVPLAKKRIRQLGGSADDLSFIDNLIKQYEQGDLELWRYELSKNVYILMSYAEVNVTTSSPANKNLIPENLTLGQIRNRVASYLGEMDLDLFSEQHHSKIIEELRRKLKQRGRLDCIEITMLEKAERELKKIELKHDRYLKNLNSRLEANKGRL